MRLIIGGFSQGKLAFLFSQGTILPEEVIDGEACPLYDPLKAKALNHLHLLVRRLLLDNADPRKIVADLADQNPEITILCDEIGSGVVPMDPFERLWREETGRICCELAARADRVDRIFCGVCTTIKPAKGES